MANTHQAKKRRSEPGDRRTVVLELQLTGGVDGLPPPASQSARLALLTTLTKGAIIAFRSHLRSLRTMDPQLTFVTPSRISPVVQMTTTTRVIDALSRLPEVKNLQPAPSFSLAGE
jgi:hypothetical protein